MKTDEIFDLVDRNDAVYGTATREECHSNPKLIHRTVHFTLIDQRKSKVFLTRRSVGKEHDAGKYCFLGEHILTGESYDDAIKRGMIEELGFVPKKFREIVHNIFTYNTQTEFVRFYIVFWNGEKIVWDEKEIEQIFWIKAGSLENDKFNFSEMTKHWINNVDWNSVFK